MYAEYIGEYTTCSDGLAHVNDVVHAPPPAPPLLEPELPPLDPPELDEPLLELDGKPSLEVVDEQAAPRATVPERTPRSPSTAA
jgi:hypothetical protein